MLEKIPIGDKAWIAQIDGFLAPDEADVLLGALRDRIAWEQRHNVVGDDLRPQARLVGWAGVLPYRYSGQTLEPREPTEALRALWARVEEACGQAFNHAVLNRYRTGADHIARHADNEPELGRSPVIAGVSLGAPRRFVLERRRGSRVRTVPLRHGQLFVMGGTLQHTWLHRIPSDPEVAAERINVTFRWLHGPPGWRAPGDPRGAR